MAVFDLGNPFGSATGTSGDDLFNLVEGGALYQINGLAGNDTVSFGRGRSPLYVILPPGSTGTVVVDSVSGASWFYHVELKNVEVVTWDGGATVIYLDPWFRAINGTQNDDALIGTAKAEYINGLGGNDTLGGGGGNDIIDGGSGVNTALFSGPRDNYTFDFFATRTVTDKTGSDGDDTLSNIQVLKFADLGVHYALSGTLDTTVSGKDSIHVTNVALFNANVSSAWTAGSESNNDSIANIFARGFAVDLSAITTGKGYNIINDGAGTTFKGSGLDDVIALTAGDGSWTAGYAAMNEGSPGFAGTGRQVLLDGKHRFADVTDGGNGSDTLQLPDGGNAFFLHDAHSLFSVGIPLVDDVRQMHSTARLTNVEVIKAGSGGDIIDLTSHDYRINGVSILGGAGNDVLWGNAGDDTLAGGIGNDTLFGGAGHNTLSGGAGADSFQFVKNGGAHDVIQDFEPGKDEIQLFEMASTSEVTVALSGGHVVLTWGDQTIELGGIASTAGATDWFHSG